MKLKRINCNVCGVDTAKPAGKRCAPGGENNLETDIVQCLSCGLLYPNPMPFREQNEIQRDFKDPEEYFSGQITEGRLKKYEKIMKMIEKVKLDKGNLLDIGCGRGELAHVAVKRKWNVVGTEVSESFARYAEERFGVSVLRGDIDDLQLRKGNFDVVCLSSVIQYVQDPLKTLIKIHSFLKENGILYIEVTNEDALVFKIGDFYASIKAGKKIMTHLSPLFPSFQIYGFNKRSLSKALEKAGFKVRSIKVKGAIGGGRLQGYGLIGIIVNLVRKFIIFMGGITGNGHLIYCLAEKR